MKNFQSSFRLRHENILPLMGYSCDGPELCLVYDYMFNGSLSSSLESCRYVAKRLFHKKVFFFSEKKGKYYDIFRKKSKKYLDNAFSTLGNFFLRSNRFAPNAIACA